MEGLIVLFIFIGLPVIIIFAFKYFIDDMYAGLAGTHQGYHDQRMGNEPPTDEMIAVDWPRNIRAYKVDYNKTFLRRGKEGPYDV